MLHVLIDALDLFKARKLAGIKVDKPLLYVGGDDIVLFNKYLHICLKGKASPIFKTSPVVISLDDYFFWDAVSDANTDFYRKKDSSPLFLDIAAPSLFGQGYVLRNNRPYSRIYAKDVTDAYIKSFNQIKGMWQEPRYSSCRSKAIKNMLVSANLANLGNGKAVKAVLVLGFQKIGILAIHPSFSVYTSTSLCFSNYEYTTTAEIPLNVLPILLKFLRINKRITLIAEGSYVGIFGQVFGCPAAIVWPHHAANFSLLANFINTPKYYASRTLPQLSKVQTIFDDKNQITYYNDNTGLLVFAGKSRGLDTIYVTV